MAEMKERHMGKVIHEEGKFFVVVNDVRSELPLGLMADEGKLKQLVGKEVEVLFTEPTRFIIALVPQVPRIPRIICYIPAPDTIYGRTVITAVEKAARVNLADQLLEGGIISQAVHDKIVE
jgi:hypothetical protein